MKTSDIAELTLSFQKSRIFLTAYELGIFTAVGNNSKTSEKIAAAINASPRYIDRLMNALCAIGLLKKTGNMFSNTQFSSRHLVKNNPGFMKGIAHSVNMWDTWSALTDTIRRGGPASKKFINDRGEEWLRPFIAAMHERASQSASAIVRLLELSGVSKVLDVGGGSGAYAMAFAKARKGITATIFDCPNVIPIAKDYVKEEGLLDKVEFIAGDYNKDDFGKGYDLVFLSAIIHINSPEQNRVLIGSSARALRGNGRIVIQDFIMDEDRTRPQWGAFFALNMLVATESGDTYTESEVRAWLKEADFTGIVRKDTKFGTALIIGRKRDPNSS